jgi:hypothetical protein
MSAGKGDARRPYNAAKYAENYDNIFRNHLKLLEKVKEVTNKSVQDKKQNKIK